VQLESKHAGVLFQAGTSKIGEASAEATANSIKCVFEDSRNLLSTAATCKRSHVTDLSLPIRRLSAEPLASCTSLLDWNNGKDQHATSICTSCSLLRLFYVPLPFLQ